jgi:hypothetical protein
MKKIIKCELGCCDNCLFYTFETGYCAWLRNYAQNPASSCDNFVCATCNKHFKKKDLLNEKA